MFYLQCTGRSGSTFLRDLLNSHPSIRMKGEFLNPNPNARNTLHDFWAQLVQDDRAWIVPVRRAEMVSRFFEAQCSDGGDVVGYDLKLEYLAGEPTLFNPLFAHVDRVVLLKRRNLLHQLVSNDTMRARIASGVTAVHSSETPAPVKISLDPVHAVARMRATSRLVSQYEAKVREIKPVFEIFYEDLAQANRAELLGELQAFLGVEPRQLTSSLSKQNPYPLEETIANFPAVAAALAETEFASFLEGR
ncbi:sulfotransferase [Pseudohoeflea coraliihabitans]|uniref:Sulfotransferase n=1 Tax=Pseudohoeflea coraliihabitans TaxID=2860393 RepID=A0ABS6WMT7_9HYPH|nr:sulfotransferase [Pseudohoeflea sp. DP4N28-3]MBW3097268.1 sulfotransferase [Pseudohoeflea sp. DP4N28-3]